MTVAAVHRSAPTRADQVCACGGIWLKGLTTSIAPDIILGADHAAILNSDLLLPDIGKVSLVEAPSIEASTPIENPIVISLDLALDSAAATVVVALGPTVVANSKETTPNTAPLPTAQPLFAAAPMSAE